MIYLDELESYTTTTKADAGSGLGGGSFQQEHLVSYM